MYPFLLALGAVVTASGIALIGSGVSVQEHTFDPAILTLGAIGIIGGLIVIGLGWIAHVLQLIQQTLAARPMRTAQPGEIATVAAVGEQASPPVRIPFPPRPKVEPLPQPPPQPAIVAAPPPEPEPVPEVAVEQPREKFPALVRLDSAPIVAEGEVSLSPRPPGQLDEVPGILANGHAPSGANGAAQVKLTPEAETNVRPLTPPERRKVSVFESLWPKGPRAGRQAQTAAVPIPVPPPVEPEQNVEPEASVPPAPQPAVAISILKSGVVDGMAYTLYSDGSIEAQLPQGTLRFGSITELRNHIEHGS